MNKPMFEDMPEPADIVIREFTAGGHTEIDVEQKDNSALLRKGKQVIILATIALMLLFIANDFFTAWLVKILGG